MWQKRMRAAMFVWVMQHELFIKCNTRTLPTDMQFWHVWIYDLQCKTIYPGLPRYKVCYVLPAWIWKVSLTRACTSSWKDNNEMWWSRVSANLLQWGLWHDVPSWSINLYPGSIRWKHGTKIRDKCIMTCSERVTNVISSALKENVNTNAMPKFVNILA